VDSNQEMTCLVLFLAFIVFIVGCVLSGTGVIPS
jgi:hypothetical protein